MRRRRRYEVVVEGLSGQAASHRSVISDHRSEAEARENARLERSRLEVIYGEGARAWRILVCRDDEIVAEEIPHGGDEPRRRAAERAPRARVERPPASDPGPPTPREPGAPTPGGTAATEPRVSEDGEPSAAARGDGPVPDWLIARVEESIARQRDRTYGTSSPADDGDDPPRR